MTEFIIKVSDNSDSNFLKRVFKSIEGVIEVRVKEKKAAKEDEWLDNLRAARASFNPALIDKNDDRTNYLLR